MNQKKNEAAENKSAAEEAAEKKQQTNTAEENAKKVAEAANADVSAELQRAVPKKPEDPLTVGSAGRTNSGEQRTTGTLLVDPQSEPKAEVKAGRIELNATPGPQAYSQVLRTADPTDTRDPRLVKVKIKYPADFEGNKYLVDGQTYEVSPETAWQFIHEHKIGREVKD